MYVLKSLSNGYTHMLQNTVQYLAHNTYENGLILKLDMPFLEIITYSTVHITCKPISHWLGNLITKH